jgi:hypothetical protein
VHKNYITSYAKTKFGLNEFNIEEGSYKDMFGNTYTIDSEYNNYYDLVYNPIAEQEIYNRFYSKQQLEDNVYVVTYRYGKPLDSEKTEFEDLGVTKVYLEFNYDTSNSLHINDFTIIKITYEEIK